MCFGVLIDTTVSLTGLTAWFSLLEYSCLPVPFFLEVLLARAAI